MTGNGTSRLTGATIVLTGATSGIGYATALALAPRAGRLILHGIEPEARVAERLASIRAVQGPGMVMNYHLADFGLLAEVRRLASTIAGAAAGRIDVLINNAGRPGLPRRTLTADGNEATLQTNYLAPVLLTAELLRQLGEGGVRRIVNIASATHLSAALELDDLNLERHRYGQTEAYARSKLALVIHSCRLAAHRPDAKLEVVSMHPGVIATPLLHAMFSIGGAQPESAARAIVHVAGRSGDNGTYYDEERPGRPNPLAHDAAVQDRLQAATEALLGDG